MIPNQLVIYNCITAKQLKDGILASVEPLFEDV